MKDRVREAVFNLLGPTVRGKHAVDLFAGTGALGWEALSRGAVRATFIEQHLPTAAALRRTAAELGVEAETTVAAADAFLWFRRGGELGAIPWLVFSSPPYDFYVDRREEMLALLSGLIATAPMESLFVVESDGVSTSPCCPIPPPGTSAAIRRPWWESTKRDWGLGIRDWKEAQQPRMKHG